MTMQLFPSLTPEYILNEDSYIIRGLVATAKGVAMMKKPYSEEP